MSASFNEKDGLGFDDEIAAEESSIIVNTQQPQAASNQYLSHNNSEPSKNLARDEPDENLLPQHLTSNDDNIIELPQLPQELKPQKSQSEKATSKLPMQIPSSVSPSNKENAVGDQNDPKKRAFSRLFDNPPSNLKLKIKVLYSSLMIF